MNIILLTPEDWLNNRVVRLTDRRHEHIKTILKSVVGDTLRVGLWGGDRGAGVVAKTTSSCTELEITLSDPPLPRHPFDIALGLPRPKMLRRVLRTAAEMGVANLHLIHSARVEKSFWQSPLLHESRITAALQAGMERSGDTIPPTVHLHRLFRPFVEDHLPGLIGERAGWLADPGADQPLNPSREPGLILLGPEGGFVPFEIALAQSVGVTAGHLGTRVLSVDTALAATLSQALG